MSVLKWLIELIFALVVTMSPLSGWGSPASPEPETEIGSALSCEVVSETEIECREVFEDGTVIEWREQR